MHIYLSLHFLLGLVHSIVFVSQSVDALLQSINVALHLLLDIVMTFNRLMLIIQTLLVFIQL